MRTSRRVTSISSLRARSLKTAWWEMSIARVGFSTVYSGRPKCMYAVDVYILGRKRHRSNPPTRATTRGMKMSHFLRHTMLSISRNSMPFFSPGNCGVPRSNIFIGISST